MTMQDPQLLERAALLAQKCARQSQEIIALKRNIGRLERELAQVNRRAEEAAQGGPTSPEAPPEAPTPQAEPSGPPEALQEPATHVPAEFMAAMEAVFEAGVKGGRVPGDWKDLPSGALYGKLKSLLGHAAQGEFVSAACNAVILWWHQERGDG